jgi:hypothetical protein
MLPDFLVTGRSGYPVNKSRTSLLCEICKSYLRRISIIKYLFIYKKNNFWFYEMYLWVRNWFLSVLKKHENQGVIHVTNIFLVPLLGNL